MDARLYGAYEPKRTFARILRPRHTKAGAVFTAAAASLLLLSACQTAQFSETKTQAYLRDAAYVSTLETKALSGVYEGVIPCADCSGIRTALYVRAIGSYTRVSHYMGTNGAFEEGGRWHVDDTRLDGRFNEADGTVVVFEPLSAKDHKWYGLVSGKQMKLLDHEGNIVEGALADFYVLEKN